jgi:hypothetical protein
MPRPKPSRPPRRLLITLPAAAAEILDRIAAEHPNERDQPSPSNAVAWLLGEHEMREAVERAKAKGERP